MKLDAKNLKLLAELEKDGNASISQIAKKIGVSKEVANYRFKQLNSTIIKKFDTIVDYFALGYQCYKLIINLQNMKYHMRETIIKELKKSELIHVGIYLFSDWDLEIDIWVKNPEELHTFYNDFIFKYSDYIAEKEFMLVSRIHLLSNQYIHGGKHKILLGNEKQVSVDEIDEKIIDVLENYPREDLLAISNKLEMPHHVVRYRIQQLTKKNILRGTVAVLDPNVAGYSKYQIQITLNQPSERGKLVEYLSNQKNVTKVTEMIGKKDLGFDACFKVNSELDKFLEEMRLYVPAIKDFEVMNLVME